MDKRYQVFISSTFEDLKIERQNVLKAILELDNMPAGMELFPATDSEAWDLIKDVIDASDYYALIIGGRYGSMDSTGISFTEKEYDYAISKEKPVIALLHKQPDNLPRGKTETDPKAWKKLKEFRSKVEKSHTCVYWNNPDELKAQLIVGLTKTIKQKPANGWIKADKATSAESLKEILDLRKEVQDLEKQIEAENFGIPEGVDKLKQGDDVHKIKCTFTGRKDFLDEDGWEDYSEEDYSGEINTTWNQIWGAISPTLISEASSRELKNSLDTFLEKTGKKIWEDKGKLKDVKLSYFKFDDEIYDTIFIQFRALGLMKESVKARSVKDTRTYWTLTKYGDNLMMKFRALKKEKTEKEAKGSKVIKVTI